jgi:endo-1,4-beta-xylanase
VERIIRKLGVWSTLVLGAGLAFPMLASAQSGPTLRSLTPSGFMIGAGATDTSQLSDSSYTSILGAQYTDIEPGTVCDQFVLEPSNGTFDFTSCDAVVAFAQAHGQHVTVTAPIWDGNLLGCGGSDYGGGNPAWLCNGTWTAAQVESILQTYITTVLQHYQKTYPGVANRWALVSEAEHLCRTYCQVLGNDSSGYPAYIALAYKYARAADSSVQLCYDDFGGESSSGSSYVSEHAIVSNLKSQGLIDCVGFEGQWEGDSISSLPSGSAISANIQRYKTLGVPVYFSQVEIAIASSNCTTASDPSTDYTTQANKYTDILTNACLSNFPSCNGFMTWGVTDKYAFCYASGHGAPVPYDLNYNPKPAFSALQAALSSTGSAAKPRAPGQLTSIVQ